jgi:hypothetical protein
VLGVDDHDRIGIAVLDDFGGVPAGAAAARKADRTKGSAGKKFEVAVTLAIVSLFDDLARGRTVAVESFGNRWLGEDRLDVPSVGLAIALSDKQ